MTFQEISAGYGVPLASLYRGTGLPDRIAPAARFNTIGKTYNLKFEPDKIREVVIAHLAGKPISRTRYRKVRQPPPRQPRRRRGLRKAAARNTRLVQ